MSFKNKICNINIQKNNKNFHFKHCKICNNYNNLYDFCEKCKIKICDMHKNQIDCPEEKWEYEDLKDILSEYSKEYLNKPVISVIIPVVYTEKESNLIKTVKNILFYAKNKKDIEIVIVFDGMKNTNYFDDYKIKQIKIDSFRGTRVCENTGVKNAIGKYILKIDSHCSLSLNWDEELLKNIRDKMILICTLDSLNEKTWRRKGHLYNFVYINKDFEEKWWLKKNDVNKDIERTMSFTGCGYFCRKDFYLDIGGFDESLPTWGIQGPELTMKAVKNGGEIFLSNNVFCGHVFNTKKDGYPLYYQYEVKQYLFKEYSNILYDYVRTFDDLPEWNLK